MFVSPCALLNCAIPENEKLKKSTGKINHTLLIRAPTDLINCIMFSLHFLTYQMASADMRKKAFMSKQDNQLLMSIGLFSQLKKQIYSCGDNIQLLTDVLFK